MELKTKNRDKRWQSPLRGQANIKSRRGSRRGTVPEKGTATFFCGQAKGKGTVPKWGQADEKGWKAAGSRICADMHKQILRWRYLSRHTKQNFLTAPAVVFHFGIDFSVAISCWLLSAKSFSHRKSSRRWCPQCRRLSARRLFQYMRRWCPSLR